MPIFKTKDFDKNIRESRKWSEKYEKRLESKLDSKSKAKLKLFLSKNFEKVNDFLEKYKGNIPKVVPEDPTSKKEFVATRNFVNWLDNLMETDLVKLKKSVYTYANFTAKHFGLSTYALRDENNPQKINKQFARSLKDKLGIDEEDKSKGKNLQMIHSYVWTSLTINGNRLNKDSDIVFKIKLPKNTAVLFKSENLSTKKQIDENTSISGLIINRDYLFNYKKIQIIPDPHDGSREIIQIEVSLPKN